VEDLKNIMSSFNEGDVIICLILDNTELKLRDIADALGISHTHVEWRAARAREMIEKLASEGKLSTPVKT
jgi:transposase-like protein